MSYLMTIYGRCFSHSPSFKPKKVNAFSSTKSVFFDGPSSTEFINLGEPANISATLTTTELSFSCWFRRTVPGANYGVGLISKADLNLGKYHYAFFVSNLGALTGWFGDHISPRVILSGNSAVTVNTWYHGVYTVTNIGGTFTGNIWLNGVQVPGSVAVTTSTAPGVTVKLGALSASPSANSQFDGNMDEVTFWNVGLTASEISLLYNNGKPSNPQNATRAANLIHWYRMGEGDTYPVISDQIGGVSATMTNMAITNIVNVGP